MRRASSWPARIFCLGTAAALLYLRFGRNDGIIGDALDYHRLALWLARSNFFSMDGIHPSALRPPLYPFFVSLVYRAVGPFPAAVQALQTALAGGTAALVFALVRLDHSERKSRWSGALCAVHPVLAAYASYLLSETLFAFLLSLGVYLHRRAGKTGRVDVAAASGAAFGLACLTRVVLFYFPVAWVVFEWARARRASAQTCAWLCAFCLCLLPWAVRNYVRFRVVLPVSIGGGYALWAGSQPGRYPATADYAKFIAPYAWESPEGDKVGTAKAIRQYRANLPRVLPDLPGRSLHFWLTSHSAVFGYPEAFGRYWRERDPGALAVKGAGFAAQLALLFWAACGAVRARRREEAYLPLALVLYIWLVIVATDYWPNRYHVPLIPLLICLGAYGF